MSRATGLTIALLAFCALGPTTERLATRTDDWAERFARERALAARDPAHQPRLTGGAPALGEDARIEGDGAHVSVGGRRGLSLGLAAIGRDGAMRAARSSAPEVAGPEVRIARGDGVIEWWRSLPSGLEQGVTIPERPPGRGLLRLEMAVRDARPELVSADEVALRDAGGALVSRYAHVVALDAGGARVPARLAVAGARIRIDVDDAAARYPLVVDPLLSVVEEATLLPSDPSGSDYFGRSAAITADGTRAVVGVPNDDDATHSNSGSARVFVRSGTTWTQEATLLPESSFGAGIFGDSVAITPDGTRVIVGAPQDDTRADTAGCATVFVRSGATWTLEQTLLAPDAATDDQLGRAVAIDSSGTRAIVGAPSDDVSGVLGAGSARVFVRSGAAWVQEAVLTAADRASGDNLGGAVAISGDGTRALVGARSDDDAVGGENAGSARVFVRSGTTWTEEATLLASGRAMFDYFGRAVALDATGTRALVGADGDDDGGMFGVGSARVFVRTGVTWSEEAALFAMPPRAEERAGSSVALSGDGLRALVGAPGADAITSAGRVYVFELVSGSTWTEAARIDAAGGGVGDHLGNAVALADAAALALVAADGYNAAGLSDTGSARVFSLAPASADGTPCATGSECVSGFCSDGLCCETDCGDASDDCRACSVAAGGDADGSCTPLSAAVAPMVECRPAAGPCDVVERCDAASTECPPDVLASADFVCRPAPDASCELPETCDGVTAECPAGGRPAPADSVCRAAVDLCDEEERCDGSSTACPTNALRGPGEECRPSLGSCDEIDFCSGGSAECPDVLSPPGSTCELGTASGICQDGLCCERACGECEVCGAGGACEPMADGEACSAQCGADGTCSAGVCIAACPDTGGMPDGGARQRAHVSGCKCGVTGNHAPSSSLGLLALLLALRIARRRSGRRRRKARS